MPHDLPELPPEPQAPSPSGAGESAANAPRRATLRFMGLHPLRWIALGAGSGLAPVAPGTFGTLAGWAAFVLIDPWLSARGWAALLLAGLVLGWWACTATARAMRVSDPGAVVWDEILAIWLILWVLAPQPWWGQALAFGLFRFYDAAKPGPVGWADRLFKGRPGEPPGWSQGFGILFDDLVAAACTLGTWAAGALLWQRLHG